jgi:hypothetical protein
MEFRDLLRRHAGLRLAFVHPDGEAIPVGFHITEVGHVAKRSMDCGGQLRTAEAVVLQAWIPDSDNGHRLTAGKAADILDRAKGVIPSGSLEVEVEYEGCALSQYTLLRHQAGGGEIRFQMGRKHADCLAREACGAAPAPEGTGAGCCP